MIDTPKVVQSPEQRTAMIHLTVPRNEIQKVMGPGLQEVNEALAAQGVQATGPWFTHHRKMDPRVFDFELCVPVSSTVTAVGRVTPGLRKARTVARTIYRGGYEGLGAAWGSSRTGSGGRRSTRRRICGRSTSPAPRPAQIRAPTGPS